MQEEGVSVGGFGIDSQTLDLDVYLYVCAHPVVLLRELVLLDHGAHGLCVVFATINCDQFVNPSPDQPTPLDRSPHNPSHQHNTQAAAAAAAGPRPNARTYPVVDDDALPEEPVEIGQHRVSPPHEAGVVRAARVLRRRHAAACCLLPLLAAACPNDCPSRRVIERAAGRETGKGDPDGRGDLARRSVARVRRPIVIDFAQIYTPAPTQPGPPR